MRNVSDKSCKKIKPKFDVKGKGKGKVHPRTGHENPEGE
jgi:hypothetical protein